MAVIPSQIEKDQERLRLLNNLSGLVNSNSYKESFGKWLEEYERDAVQKLTDSSSSDIQLPDNLATLRFVRNFKFRIQSMLEEKERLQKKLSGL